MSKSKFNIHFLLTAVLISNNTYIKKYILAANWLTFFTRLASFVWLPFVAQEVVKDFYFNVETAAYGGLMRAAQTQPNSNRVGLYKKLFIEIKEV